MPCKHMEARLEPLGAASEPPLAQSQKMIIAVMNAVARKHSIHEQGKFGLDVLSNRTFTQHKN